MTEHGGPQKAADYLWIDASSKDGRQRAIRQHVMRSHQRQMGKSLGKRASQHQSSNGRKTSLYPAPTASRSSTLPRWDNHDNGTSSQLITVPASSRVHEETKADQRVCKVTKHESKPLEPDMHVLPRRLASLHQSKSSLLTDDYAFVSSMLRELPPTLESDRMLRLLNLCRTTYLEVCLMKKAQNALLKPRQSEQQTVQRYNDFIVLGCRRLESHDTVAAFAAFDHGFTYCRQLLLHLSLQGLPLICNILLRFRGPKYHHVFLQLFRYTENLAAVMVGDEHPVRKLAACFLSEGIPMDVCADIILPCVLEVLQQQMGTNHVDSLAVLKLMAWSWLQLDRFAGAMGCFQQLVTLQEQIHGLQSTEAAEAMLGLAEARVRLGDLEAAEHILDDVLGRRLRHIAGVDADTLRVKAMRSLASLETRKDNLFRARWVLQQAGDLAHSTFGNGHWKVMRIKNDTNVLDKAIDAISLFKY